VVSEGKDFNSALIIIIIMAIFNLVTFIFDRWYWCYRNPLMRKKLHMKMHKELFRKALSLDLSCFDDPEFYDDFVWAMNESDNRAIEVIEDTGKLINRIVASFTLFGVLFSVDPMIAIILLSSTFITMICNLIDNKKSFEHSKVTNPLYRKKAYINRVYHLSDFAKELRVHRVDDLLMKDYDENTEKLKKADIRFGKYYFIYNGLGWNVLATLTFYVVTVYMIYMLSIEKMDIGGFAASASMIWRVRWLLSDLAERITKYSKHSLFIEKYLEFMRFEPIIKDGSEEIPEFESLELKNVSFSYEFSSHPKYKFHDEDHKPKKDSNEGSKVLNDISLKINRGDKIAIVGYNGAGKTTLIKLMMRLYDPNEGEILYNGKNIKEYDPVKYRERIGTVFQDYKIFATSIAENVMNGEYDESKRDTVLKALSSADFTEKLNSLENGLDTHLTREFNDKGTELSGGEAQKIAISRVFAKDHPIVIMDEPSSALDPMAEYNLNQSILNNTEDKTVIFISHRLSTTRIADKIFMFDNGDLIEEGSHEELLEKDGKYAEMFRVQSENYKEYH